MKTKLLTLFVALVCATQVFAYDFEVNNLCYNKLGGDSVEVTYRSSPSSSSNKYTGYVTIPKTVTYNDTTYRVTALGKESFKMCTELTSVTIPKSIISIGESAFSRCSKLTSVTIPNSVTTIGQSAFAYCYSITSITIPNGVTSISYGTFYHCSSLKAITIPESVTRIEAGTFQGCSNVETIIVKAGNPTYHSIDNCLVLTASRTLHTGCKNSIIPTDGSVTSIGTDAFNGCSGLTSLYIPKSIISIGSYAFKGCSGVETITVEEGNPTYHSAGNCLIETVAKTLLTGCKNSIIPTDGSVTTIAGRAFYDCSDLMSINIPNTITTIYGSAFYGCSGLTSITIPNSIKTIYGFTFDQCVGLTSVTIPKSVTKIDDYAFQGCYKLYEIYNFSKLTFTIGSSDNGRIASYAKYIHTTNEPSKIKTQGDYLFLEETDANYLIAYSGKETDITLPENYNGKSYQIGEYAFRDCSRLTSVTIPNSVTAICEEAFYYCSNLTEINIGSGVTKMDDFFIFYGCSALKSIIWNAQNIELSSGGPFIADVREQITSFTFGDSMQHIPDYICNGMSNLTSITIPETITTIGKYAFNGCYSITSVIWKAQNMQDFTSSSNTPFYDARKNITSFTFGDSVQHIPAYLCCGLTNLTSITIPKSVVSVGKSAFGSCSGLTSVIWNAQYVKNFTSSNRPFSYSNVTSFTFGDSVQHIPAYLCYHMTKLTSITIPNSVTTIGNDALGYCSGIKSITIPEGVISIGDYAFSSCSGLASITIPKNVISMGKSVFQSCSNLTSVIWNAQNVQDFTKSYEGPFSIVSTQITSFTFGEGVQHIPAYLCYDMTKLTSITIPNSVTTIGVGAFYRCTDLMSITCLATTPPIISKSTFSNVDHSIPLYVPAESVESYKTALYWKDFTNIQPLKYTLTVTAGIGGSVTGGGEYAADSIATLTAIPDSGYRFTQWSDGNTDNPRSIIVTGNAEYTAIFVEETPITAIEGCEIRNTQSIKVFENGTIYILRNGEKYTVDGRRVM